MLIQGTVFSNEMKLLPNVSVEVLGEYQSTQTDSNGRFSIMVMSPASQLRFDAVGYDYDTISVAEFQKLGYIELWQKTLDNVDVINNYQKPDNSLAWILGILAVVGIGFALSNSSKKAVNVKA